MLARSGDITEPCPVPLVTDGHDSVFQYARLQPFLDQADDARIADSMLQKTNRPFLTDFVKEAADVGIENPVHLRVVDSDTERVERIVRAPPWPEPIREPEEVFLVDRVQHRRRRSLDDLVLQSGDRERTLSPVRLWDVDPP